MRSSGIHDACNEGDNGELRKPKGHDSKGETEDGEEDGILLLGCSQSIEVSAIAIANGNNSNSYLAPDEDL